jgi:fatty-acyl-CoA synthase
MRDVAVGEVGEIVHRSPQLLMRLLQRPRENRTKAAFEGGWFHSGDLATIDAEGYITVVDRKKDMIKTGGENVASREVEECRLCAGRGERGGGDRPARPAMDRSGHGRDRRQSWRSADRGGSDRPLHASGMASFKSPKRVMFVDSPAQEPQRQDPQARFAPAHAA